VPTVYGIGRTGFRDHAFDDSMILDWNADSYLDGIGYAFVSELPLTTAFESIAEYQIVYDPWTLVRVEYGSGVPAVTSGAFRADGAGFAEFTPEYIESFFWAHGAGGSTWTGYSDLVNGFNADGTGTCEFFLSANSLKMQGSGGATFEGASQPAPTGFKAQGSGNARFFGGAGVGEDCLTSKDTLPGGQVPNFVY
jgi:hypothetical protein